MFDGLEKRNFQRLELPLEVTVEIESAPELPKVPPRQQIQSRNISRNGICLETNSLKISGFDLLSGPPFARNNRLQLSIKLIPEEPPLTATGEVRWYDIIRGASESLYLLGVEFVAIRDAGKERLARFLKRNQNNGKIVVDTAGIFNKPDRISEAEK